MFKWDTPTRTDAQVQAAKAEAATERAVYAQVTAADEHRCRVCGVWCTPDATTLLGKGHHHHIVYRSAGGPTTVENVCLLCARCHNDEHQHRIAIDGNAHQAPWLTLSRRDPETGEWYVWRQEVGRRRYERD